MSSTEEIHDDIRKLVLQQNYPCVAAVKALRDSEYIVKVYQDFGTAKQWQKLREDLQSFVHEQKRTGSTYLTFWAVFEGETQFSEVDFESRLWNELSHVTSLESKDNDWNGDQNINPEDPEFCLSIDGQPLFVVGLHPNSSRLARRFSRPALVFNSIAQFENLERSGEYESMKKAIRKRDIKLQGSVNPMVEKHGDAWETIQFSGKENPAIWKCPFHFMSEKDK